MEERKPAQTAAPTEVSNLNPNPKTAQSLPTQPPPTPPLSLPPQSKKRPLDQIAKIQDSSYFKMRLIVKNLRPHFIEVLKTPYFKNSEAAHKIREELKLLMDLYKEMTAETEVSEEKSKNGPEGPLPSKILDGQKPREYHQDVKSAVQLPADRTFAKPSTDRPIMLGKIADTQPSEDGRNQGTYVVGGSAFGWNFITYTGSKAVYCGRTKEEYRAANVFSNEAPSMA